MRYVHIYDTEKGKKRTCSLFIFSELRKANTAKMSTEAKLDLQVKKMDTKIQKLDKKTDTTKKELQEDALTLMGQFFFNIFIILCIQVQLLMENRFYVRPYANNLQQGRTLCYGLYLLIKFYFNIIIAYYIVMRSIQINDQEL